MWGSEAHGAEKQAGLEVKEVEQVAEIKVKEFRCVSKDALPMPMHQQINRRKTSAAGHVGSAMQKFHKSKLERPPGAKCAYHRGTSIAECGNRSALGVGA